MFGWNIRERFIGFLKSLVEVVRRDDVVSLAFGCLFVLLGFVGVLLNAEGLISRLLSLVYCIVMIVGVWLVFNSLGKG
jgi:hypothetical protein